MLALLLESSIRATLVILLAAILLRVLRVRNAPARHTVWAALMATMLLMPVIVAWAPIFDLPLLPEQNRAVRVPLIVETSSPTEPTIALSETPVAVTEVSASSATIPWERLAWVAYLAGAAIFLIRLAVGTYQVRRLLKQSRTDGGQRIHPGCATPFTVGWLRPVMILPVRGQSGRSSNCTRS
jgi:hypothetical protein